VILLTKVDTIDPDVKTQYEHVYSSEPVCEAIDMVVKKSGFSHNQIFRAQLYNEAPDRHPQIECSSMLCLAEAVNQAFFTKKKVLLDMPEPIPKADKPIKEWSIADVTEWLSDPETKLANWTGLFGEHQIDGEDLLELTSERLAEFGVESGVTQARIMGAIERLKVNSSKS